MMKMFARAAVAALSTAMMATSAQAASMINADGSVLLDASDSPFTFRVDYAVAGQPNLDGFGLFTFTGTSGSNSQYNFDFTIRNESDAVSRLSVFGFDTNRNIVGASSSGSGDFDVIVLNPNDVAAVGTVDVCFKDAGGANCANGQTGGAGGLARNTAASGAFSLNIDPARPTLTIEDFFVRFQGVGANDSNFTGVGTVRNIPVSPVPEPATWAMMLGGFGLVGAAMRRRRSAGIRHAIA